MGFNIRTLFHRGYSLHICGSIASNPRDALLMNVLLGDIGGQRTLRPFWRNHFEETDALVWVIDSCDEQRFHDCKAELFSLLQEEVILCEQMCRHT